MVYNIDKIHQLFNESEKIAFALFKTRESIKQHFVLNSTLWNNSDLFKFHEIIVRYKV
jgi:hypothetical protein